jgi:hypothetical protein
MKTSTARAAAIALGASIALALTGCPGGHGTDTDAGTDPGMAYGYVVNSMTMPTPAAPVGLDIDGDGATDNALGTLLAFIPTLAPDFDVQTTIDGNLMAGTLVLLWQVAGVNGFTADSDVNVDTAPGEAAMTDLLAYTGGGSFAVSATAPASDPLTGGIGGGGTCTVDVGAGGLETCPGTIPFALPLTSVDSMNVELSFTLVSARIECQAISADALAQCTLGGAITQDEIDNRIIPDLATALNSLLPARAILDAGGNQVPCVADNMTIGDHTSATCMMLDPIAECSASNGVDTGYCVDSTSGLVGFALDSSVDADGNGVLTAAELSGLLSTFLVPDLDLEPAGAPDGTDDAISLGFDFAAASATVTGL